MQKIKSALNDKNYEEYGQLLKQDIEFLKLLVSYTLLKRTAGDLFDDMDNLDF